MNILYIYAHPNSCSFNSLLKAEGIKTLEVLKANVRLSDLYQNNYNPVASWKDFNTKTPLNNQYFLAQQEAYNKGLLTTDIQQELEKIQWANHLLFQFPLWWFSAPAILKGWLDRQLIKGVAYDAGKVFSQGLWKGKTASFVVSTQSPASAYQTSGLHQGSIELFLHSLSHTLKFVGVDVLDPFVCFGAYDLTLEKQKEFVEGYRGYLKELLKM